MEFSEAEFNKKAIELYKISELLNDNWRINEKNEKIYLTKRKTVVLKNSPSQQPPDDVDPIENELSLDPSVATTVDDDNLVSIDYHVLFHPSFQTPALYFNAYLGLLTLYLVPMIIITCFIILSFRRIPHLFRKHLKNICSRV